MCAWKTPVTNRVRRQTVRAMQKQHRRWWTDIDVFLLLFLQVRCSEIITGVKYENNTTCKSLRLWQWHVVILNVLWMEMSEPIAMNSNPIWRAMLMILKANCETVFLSEKCATVNKTTNRDDSSKLARTNGWCEKFKKLYWRVNKWRLVTGMLTTIMPTCIAALINGRLGRQ